jgi:hypothetical protein
MAIISSSSVCGLASVAESDAVIALHSSFSPCGRRWPADAGRMRGIAR